jgi:hypothetical protein
MKIKVFRCTEPNENGDIGVDCEVGAKELSMLLLEISSRRIKGARVDSTQARESTGQ